MDVAAFVLPSHTSTETLQIALRWVHFVAGFTWVGLLYFFNLVNVPFMKQVDATVKPKIFEHLTLPALWWFRWSAVVTVFAGFWYWGQTIVAVDARNGGGNAGATVGWFLLLWTAAWALQYGLILGSARGGGLKSGWAFAPIAAAIVALAAWGFVALNDSGWQSNRLLSIGIGGGIGWFMMLNVWGIIWRANKKIIRAAMEGTPAVNGVALARQAFLASRTNAWLSLPMLFFMGSASHYVIFGK